MERPVHGRFARMRPLHRYDAWRAARSPESMARLVLHETLATVSRCPKVSGAEAFEVADGWLQTSCVGILRPAARRDLTALACIYRATVCLMRKRPQESRRCLETADVLMLGGEGRHEPRVTWWTVKATRHRRLALAAQKAGRAVRPDGIDDPAEKHLAAASRCLRQALRRLPVKGYDEQRIELLHDQAQICRLRGHLDSAERLLDRAHQLFDALEDGDGGQLSPMVTMTRAWVEAQRAVEYQDEAARRIGERRVRTLLLQVLESGCLDEAEQRRENHRLEHFLRAADGALSSHRTLLEEDTQWDRCDP